MTFDNTGSNIQALCLNYHRVKTKTKFYGS